MPSWVGTTYRVYLRSGVKSAGPPRGAPSGLVAPAQEAGSRIADGACTLLSPVLHGKEYGLEHFTELYAVGSHPSTSVGGQSPGIGTRKAMPVRANVHESPARVGCCVECE